MLLYIKTYKFDSWFQSSPEDIGKGRLYLCPLPDMLPHLDMGYSSRHLCLILVLKQKDLVNIKQGNVLNVIKAVVSDLGNFVG